ncbi:MAG: HlyC/CorC family transporter [Clostridia bacterium]|nr:HlyC/CorC family transporter [Clostridia bacterium]
MTPISLTILLLFLALLSFFGSILYTCLKDRDALENNLEELDQENSWIGRHIPHLYILSLFLVWGSLLGALCAIILSDAAMPCLYLALFAVLFVILCEVLSPVLLHGKEASFLLRARRIILPLYSILAVVVVPITWFVLKCKPLLLRNAPQDEELSDEELSDLIDTVEDTGEIDEEQADLLQSALEFDDVTAQEVLTHRMDMLAVDILDPRDRIIRKLMDSPYSRIPVYEDSIDNIIGIIHINHFLRAMVEDPDFSFRDILMEACFIPKTMKLPQVLRTLKAHQTHLAVVTDEYGGTLGIVTMEDVLEELVGDIWDETDTVTEEITKQEDGSYLIDGDTSIYDLLELADIDEEDFEGDYTTVSGWVIEMLQGYPKENDHFQYRNIDLTVQKADEKRVDTVLVRILDEESDEDAQDDDSPDAKDSASDE